MKKPIPPFSDYKVEVIYHEELDEYEACIPELARYFFTSTGNTKEEAVTRLRELFPIFWINYHTPMSAQQQQQPKERPHAYEHWLRMAAEEAIQELLSAPPDDQYAWNESVDNYLDLTPYDKTRQREYYEGQLRQALHVCANRLKGEARCKR